MAESYFLITRATADPSNVGVNDHTSGDLRYDGDVEILSEKILYRNGSFMRVEQYLRGWHPEIGRLHHKGHTGKETIQEVDAIVPIQTFTVYDFSRNGHSEESNADYSDVLAASKSP